MDSARVLLSCPSHQCRHAPDAQVVSPLRIMGHMLSCQHQRVSSHPQPFRLLANGLHRQETTFDSTASSDKTDLRLSHRTVGSSDLHNMAVQCFHLPDHEPEDAQMMHFRLSDLCIDCRVEVRDEQAPFHLHPDLVLERISDEVYKKYHRKYEDNQIALQMAKTGERCSQRKRAAECEPLASTHNSASRPISKKLRLCATSSRALVSVDPVVTHKYKRRVFMERPVGPVVPNLFAQIKKPLYCEKLLHIEDEDVEPEFDPPAVSSKSTPCLRFEDLFLLSTGFAPAVAASSRDPAAKLMTRSASPESDADICDPSDSSEQPSPRSPVQKVHPLKRLKTQAHVAADRAADEVRVTLSPQKRHQCEESTDQAGSSDVSNSPVSKTIVSNEVAPSSNEPEPQTVVMPVKHKSLSPGAPERRRRCPDCFLSLLLMSPDQMRMHRSIAHPGTSF